MKVLPASARVKKRRAVLPGGAGVCYGPAPATQGSGAPIGRAFRSRPDSGRLVAMSVSTRLSGNRLVLSPREALLAGGPAREFERSVQELFKAGYRHLVTDLAGVPSIDSAGVRALVRGLTTSQRLEGSFVLVGPNLSVRTVLRTAHLESVFPIFESLERAVARRWPWKVVRLAAGGMLLVTLLVAAGNWQGAPNLFGRALPATGIPVDGSPARVMQSFAELLKLVAAAAIGLLVTAVRRWQRRARQTRSMEQAQVLLCVSGAMMMIIIGDSVARAFGIAGAAAIIRFRTPVEDPEDITVLFLLMGLGMSAGLGAFGVAGLATAFLCVLLLVLDRVGTAKPRAMMVEIEAEGREFPSAHVHSVFAQHGVVFEPREVSQGKNVAVRYHAALDPSQSLEELSDRLVSDGRAGVKAVAWEPPKKSD
jgi:anti-anti-sigma factor